mmetsp:Transcript_26182/g.33485  ORF Transcript_26182/g.33485 Transcript_26182/m.33485 type:complete len:271 (+) Transcript_26182:119-931(+)
MLPSLTVGTSELCDIAIFTILTAAAFKLRRSCRPCRRRCALFWCFEHGLDRRRDCAVRVHPAHGRHFFHAQVALEGRKNTAWMDTKRGYTKLIPTAIGTERKQGIGRLGLRIGAPLVILAFLVVRIIPVHITANVRCRRQGDQTRRSSLFHRGQKPLCKRHVAKMINAKLAFPARSNPRQRTGHDASIIDQDIQLTTAADIIICELSNRRDVCEVHTGNIDLSVHLSERFFSGIWATSRDGDVCAHACQRTDFFNTDTAIAAGDDDIFAA